MSQEKSKENRKFSKPDSIGKGKLAVIRIRGLIGLDRDIDKTLRQLNLYKKNYCVVVSNNDSNLGMVRKVKDYITWGEIDNDTYELLTEKKGEDYKNKISDNKMKYNKFLTIKDKKLKKFFRLNNPRKGYGRKGIKVSFNKGGALGYRATKIKDLIERMI